MDSARRPQRSEILHRAIGSLFLAGWLLATPGCASAPEANTSVTATPATSVRNVTLSHGVPASIGVRPLYGAAVPKILNLAATAVANGGYIEVRNAGEPVRSDTIPKGGDLDDAFAVDLSTDLTLTYVAVPGAMITVAYDFE